MAVRVTSSDPAAPVHRRVSTRSRPRASRSSAVIEDLEQRHPGMRERLLDDKGELRRFVNIYLNGDDIRFLNQLELHRSRMATISQSSQRSPADVSARARSGGARR